MKKIIWIAISLHAATAAWATDVKSIAGFQTSYSVADPNSKAPGCDVTTFSGNDKPTDGDRKACAEGTMTPAMKACVQKQAKAMQDALSSKGKNGTRGSARDKNVRDFMTAARHCQFAGINADTGYKIRIEIRNWGATDSSSSQDRRGFSDMPERDGTLVVKPSFTTNPDTCKVYSTDEIETMLREHWAGQFSKHVVGEASGCATGTLDSRQALDPSEKTQALPQPPPAPSDSGTRN